VRSDSFSIVAPQNWSILEWQLPVGNGPRTNIVRKYPDTDHPVLSPVQDSHQFMAFVAISLTLDMAAAISDTPSQQGEEWNWMEKTGNDLP
jgi:hypothetical protein